jgi:hypothetical protein
VLRGDCVAFHSMESPTTTMIASIIRWNASGNLQTTDTRPHSRGVFRPSFASSLHPLSKERAQGRPGAGWHPRSTVLNGRTRIAQRHTGEAGNNPAFPAQWLYGLCRALPGDEFSFVTVTSRIGDASTSGWLDASPQGLAVATTARTTRFCRTQQHRSSRVVRRSRGSAQSSARPALHVSRRRCPRPPQPDPRLVTTYDRPFS